ncbi:hypothetical protein N7510_006189 [Penicillium lagena]|uniref:uncharacterized protein n=1 Tax=Penicillium lagena TaxID=94218 RepID=UPI002540BA68|nr:uncharacterized protein N7510_006189 [Penicillium lagena]KAJ5612995.1 hypothetical protein N7510_006189 [Penicillium lagena]
MSWDHQRVHILQGQAHRQTGRSSNAKGEALLQALRTVYQQSGQKSSVWGRSAEDEDNLVWVVDTLTKNPVTDLSILPFASSLAASETMQLHSDLISFRTTLVGQLPQTVRPRSWAMGQIDRPSMVKHDKSPSGMAVLHLLAVGWESVEAHMNAKQTEEFGRSIAPIRDKMLGPVPGLGLKHVRFQKG